MVSEFMTMPPRLKVDRCPSCGEANWRNEPASCDEGAWHAERQILELKATIRFMAEELRHIAEATARGRTVASADVDLA